MERHWIRTPKLHTFEMNRALLERERITARSTPLFHRLQKKVHNAVDVGERQNMSDEGGEIACCAAVSLHDMPFNENLSAREGECSAERRV